MAIAPASPPKHQTLKPSQRAAIEQDYEAANEALTNPKMAPYIQDKAALAKQARNLKRTLDEQAPRPYETSEEKNAAAKRLREIEAQMQEGMPSKEEMRRNRTGEGTVHKHMKWEKRNKPFILERKEILKRLEYDSDDPDLTSYERLRPERPFVYDTTAQIAGHHAMSPQAKQNWPEEMAEPKAKTAVAHLKKK
jgi:hypothetical protein